MRIACIGNEWYPDSGGGLDRYFKGLVEQLALDGDSVDAFLSGGPQAQETNLRYIRLSDTKASFIRRMASAGVRYVSSFQGPYDVANIHFALYGLPLLPFLGRDTPIVFNFQGPWADEGIAEGNTPRRAQVKRFIELAVYRRSARFIVLSTAFQDILVERYGIERERVHVVPAGVDVQFFSPADKADARAKLGWPQDRYIAFTARRLVNRVGVAELIEAAAIVKEQAGAVWIPIAGRGYKRDELDRLIVKLGLQEHVRLLGYISEDDLAMAYRAADVTVLPSQDLEGFGYIIAESLASGTPVITTPVGGAPEAVIPLGAQLVLDSASPASIARGIVRAATGLMEFPDTDACRSYALNNYEWSIVAKRVRDVFSQAAIERTKVPSIRRFASERK